MTDQMKQPRAQHFNREATLAELLEDSALLALLQADGITQSELIALLDETRERLAA